MTAMLVAAGAAIGAPLRYVLVAAVDRRTASLAPWGVHVVNTAGSFALAVIIGAAIPAQWLALVGTGLCGAMTTYSAFAFDHVVLAERGQRLVSALSMLAGLVAGVTAALTGLVVGAASG
ncbi:MAG: CrcB family protein [Geodermatophilaceae bacterium]|nr:CrcB family protein [Geodermatophilaceae bacterium]